MKNIDGELHFHNFTITKREILASISIVAVLVIIGIMISGKISEAITDRYEIYEKAIKISDTDLFLYGMDTNVGNAFVYGDLKAVDTVTYPEIDGEYMYIKKDKYIYTLHTRSLQDGKKIYYWTWDYYGTESKRCERISFCGVELDAGKISFPDAIHVDTITKFGSVRYKYYGVPASNTGTVFTELKNRTISDNSSFYANKSISETVNSLEKSSTGTMILFWAIWISFIFGCVFAFCYMQNKWLN